MTAPTTTPADAKASESGPLLSIRGLKKHFPIKEGALQKVVGHVKAVDGVTFDLHRGETLGLVGESGCGKTTLGRTVGGLTDPTAGGAYFDLGAGGAEELDQLLAVPEPNRTEAQITRLQALNEAHRIDLINGERWDRYRRNCQVVFQSAFASLNPRHLVKDIVGRPLRVHKEASGAALTERVVELLEQVGMGRQHLYRYPHQFSGGQRQRISIARALALDPELVILDEPTSALDVSVQAQILNLLHELQQERNLAYLFITHDLSVVRHMADRIVVMYVGKVAEAGPTDVIFNRPEHPYTEALLASSPDVEGSTVDLEALEGSIPDPALPPQGCRFHTRCPVATPACGWEVDDVVRWLEESGDTLDELRGVTRASAFDAALEFSSQEAADAVAASLEREAVPTSMRAALKHHEVGDKSVRIVFDEVDEVELTLRGPAHVAACLLDRESS